MMKKSNKILIGCLALLLALSVGYALFSDTITINGTATAKGDFAYEIETMKGINSDIKTSNMYGIYYDFGVTGIDTNFESEEGISESAISNTKNTITFSSSVTQPGQVQYFTAKVTNTGTIPMTFDIYYDFTKDVSYSGKVSVSDGSEITLNNVKSNSQCIDQSIGGIDLLTNCTHLTALSQSLTELGEVYVPKNVYEKLNADFQNGIDSLPVIESGESIYLLFYSTWSNNISFLDPVVGIDITATNTITIPVKQVTIN